MATCKQLTAQTPIPDFREVGPGAGYKELYDVSPIDWGLCCGFKGPQTNPSWSPSPSSCLNTQTESSAHSIRGEGELGAWGGGPGHLWHPTYTILWPCILKRENPFKKKVGGRWEIEGMTRWLFFSSSGHQKRYLGSEIRAFILLVLSVCSHGHTAQKVKHRVNGQVMGRMVRDVSPVHC